MFRQRCLASALAFLLAVASVACSSTAPATDPVVEPAGVELTYHWRVGETTPFRMVNQIRQNMSIEMDSEESTAMPAMEMTIDQTLTGRQEVLEVDADGTARVRLTYDTLRMDLASPMMSMSWDSEEPAGGDEMSSQLETSLRPMLETPLTLEISSTGEILSVEGVEAMVEAMGAAAGGGAEMMGNLGGAGGIGGISGIDDASIEQMIRQSYFALPADRVLPGDTWADRQEVPIPFVGGVLAGDMRFTLESVSDGIARIDLAGTYDYQPSDEPGMLDQMMASLGDLDTDITIEGGAFDGELLFDLDAGRYDSVRSAVAMGMTMTMTPGADGPEGMPTVRMTMDMEMDSTVEYGALGVDEAVEAGQP